MPTPQQVLTDAVQCPHCGSERVLGKLQGGMVGDQPGTEMPITFTPFGSDVQEDVVVLACTKCGAIGLFVAHLDELLTGDA
jgi:transcription elongation factor Elf1